MTFFTLDIERDTISNNIKNTNFDNFPDFAGVRQYFNDVDVNLFRTPRKISDQPSKISKVGLCIKFI